MPRRRRPAQLTEDAPEVAAWLEQVAHGVRVRTACQRSDVPWTTISRLLTQSEPFAARYVLARKASAALRADEAGDVLRTAAADPIVKAEASAIVSIAKARAEHLRWLARVQDASSYGEKQTIEQDTTVRVLVEYASPALSTGSTESAQSAARPQVPAELAEYTIEMDDA